MATLFGIENLWKVDVHLETFRKNPEQFIDCIQMWQAVAVSCMGDTDIDFHRPNITFSTFTDLIGVAAKELLQKPIPRMREFADKAAGKKTGHSHQSPTASTKKTPTPAVSSSWTHNWSLTEAGYYSGHLPDGAPCVPSPADLQQALSEAEGLIDAQLTLPPVTIPAEDSHVEGQQAKNQDASKDKVIGEHILAQLRTAIKKEGRKARPDVVIRSAKVGNQVGRQGLRLLQKQGKYDGFGRDTPSIYKD